MASKYDYPFPCASCSREISRKTSSDPGEGLVHFGHGLCNACYMTWKNAGRPPLDTFEHHPRVMPRRVYPFDCEGCGREITHPYSGSGSGAAHGGYGLCSACHQARRRTGLSPLNA